jgi:deoxyribodipyrimidine photo-lyase
LKTIIHWFRRDLRVSDNTSLHEAYSRSEQVIPCFCWDDAILRAPDVGAARVAFLLRSLESLARNLEVLGHRLIVRHGSPREEIRRLAKETGATAVFTNRDYEPYARQRDQEVEHALAEVGIGFQSFKDSVVWEDREVLTGAGGIYTVFTPYSKAWKSRAVPPPRPRLGPAKHPVPSACASKMLPLDSGVLGHPLNQELFPAGERAAQQALEWFLANGIQGYEAGRNLPALKQGTSRLSPHLRFGTINVRTLLARRDEVRRQTESPAGLKGCDVWLNELIWREFYIQVLANHPRVAQASFRPEYDQLQWTGGDDWFDAWCAGQTGFPVVDAAMRCLRSTGWMHNRLRMIVAMFLTKDLLVSWQRGERWFMQQLVDGDLAANNGGWQWSAGTGTDAAPYFRIFNPVTQGRKFDPDGVFIRQWVPELRGVADNGLHAPWEEPLTAYRGGYVRPIVDHAVQRERCLAMFKAVRS